MIPINPPVLPAINSCQKLPASMKLTKINSNQISILSFRSPRCRNGRFIESRHDLKLKMKLSNTLLFSSLFFLFFLPKSSTISFFYSFHHVTSLSSSSSAISSFLKGSAVFSSTSSFTSLRGRFIRGISLISLSLSTLSSQSPSVSNNHDNEAQESVHLRLAQTQPFSSFFPSPKKYPVLEISEYRNLSSNETLIAMTGRNQTKLDLFAIHLYGRNFSKFPLEVVYREVTFHFIFL